MSDESNAPATGQADETKWPFPKGRDWLLARIVDQANSFGLEQGVTLSLGGTMITGTIIAHTTYFAESAENVAHWRINGENGDTLRQKLVDFYNDWGAKFAKQAGAPEDEEAPVPGYIHLRNARFLVPGGYIPSEGGMLWRGRLTSVDGFALGDITPPRLVGTPFAAA